MSFSNNIPENTDRYSFPVITNENYSVETSAEKPASAYKSLKAYEKVIRKELTCTTNDADVSKKIQDIWEGYEQKSNQMNRSCCNFIGKWCDRRSWKKTSRVYLRTQALIEGKIAQAKVLGFAPTKQDPEITEVIAHLKKKNEQLLEGLYSSDDGIRRYGKYKGHLCTRRLNIIKTRENLINIFERVGSQRKRILNTWIGNNQLNTNTRDLFFFHFLEDPARIKVELIQTADEILRLKNEGDFESEECKIQNEKFTILIRKLTALNPDLSPETEQEEIITYCVRNCLPHCLEIIREARETVGRRPLYEQRARWTIRPLIEVIFDREYSRAPQQGDHVFYSGVENVTEDHFQEMAEVLHFFLPEEEKERQRILNGIWQCALNRIDRHGVDFQRIKNLIRFLDFYSQDIKQPLTYLNSKSDNDEGWLSRERFEVLKIIFKKLNNKQCTELRFHYCTESLKWFNLNNQADVAHYMEIFKLFVDGKFVSEDESKEKLFYDNLYTRLTLICGNYQNLELFDFLIKHFISIGDDENVVTLKNILFVYSVNYCLHNILIDGDDSFNKNVKDFIVFLNKDEPRLDFNKAYEMYNAYYEKEVLEGNFYEIIDQYIDTVREDDKNNGIKKLEELRQLRQILENHDSPPTPVKSARK